MRRVILAAPALLLLVGCGTAAPTEPPPVHSAISTAGVRPRRDDASPAVSPVAEVETEQTLTCESTSGLVAAIPSFSDLTWASERIVVGEVAKIYPSVPDPKAPQQPLYTEFDVHVEQSLRGQAIDTLRIRHGGGEVPGGCSDLQGAAPVHPGDRFIFFLGYHVEQASVPTYFAIGEQQGLRGLKGNIVDDVVPWYGDFSGHLVIDVATHIESSLASSPPERSIAGSIPVVTLDPAPKGPDLPSSATPVP